MPLSKQVKRWIRHVPEIVISQSSAITSRKTSIVQLDGTPLDQRATRLCGEACQPTTCKCSCQSGEPRDGPISPASACNKADPRYIPAHHRSDFFSPSCFAHAPAASLSKRGLNSWGRWVKRPIKRLDINPGKPGPVFKARRLH